MNADLALRLVADLIWTGLLTCLPILGLTMLIGVVISIVQVVTQVQEMTLTFVPKLLVAAAVLVFFGGWMLQKLTQFTAGLWALIPSLV